MIETIITYKPEFTSRADDRITRQWRPHIRRADDIWNEIVLAGDLPGLTSAPKLQPISARQVMLQSGIRAPMAIKITGPSLEVNQAFAFQLEALLKTISSVKPTSVLADRSLGQPTLEVVPDVTKLSRYGMHPQHVLSALQVAAGGMPITEILHGRERYTLRMRSIREERDSLDAIQDLLIPTPKGISIPLSQLCSLQYKVSPSVIKAEDTFLTTYVLFDKKDSHSTLDTIRHIKQTMNHHIQSGYLNIPEGVETAFEGNYKNQIRSQKTLGPHHSARAADDRKPPLFSVSVSDVDMLYLHVHSHRPQRRHDVYLFLFAPCPTKHRLSSSRL